MRQKIKRLTDKEKKPGLTKAEEKKLANYRKILGISAAKKKQPKKEQAPPYYAGCGNPGLCEKANFDNVTSSGRLSGKSLLLFIPLDPLLDATGGATTFCKHLIDSLLSHNRNLNLIIIYRDPDEPEGTPDGKVREYFNPHSGNKETYYRVIAAWGYDERLLGEKVYNAARVALKEHKTIDAVISQEAWNGGHGSIAFANEHNIPSMLCLHGEADFKDNGRTLAIYKQADIVATNSKYNIKKLKNMGLSDAVELLPVLPTMLSFFSPDKIRAQDVGRYRRKLGLAGGRIILIPGRIHRTKGQLQALEAFKMLRSKPGYKDVVLVFAGLEQSPEYYRQVLARAKKLSFRVGKDIVFTGGITQKEMRKLYRMAELVAVPSQWEEPFGLVSIEAQAMGTPVIVTGQGGLPETVGEGAGIIVPKEETKPAKLAEAFRRVLSDKDLQERMGGAGRQAMLDKFSPAKMYDIYESAYIKLLEQKPSKKYRPEQKYGWLIDASEAEIIKKLAGKPLTLLSQGTAFSVYYCDDLDFVLKVPVSEEETRRLLARRAKGTPKAVIEAIVREAERTKAEGDRITRVLSGSDTAFPLRKIEGAVEVNLGRTLKNIRGFYVQRQAQWRLLDRITELNNQEKYDEIKFLLNEYIRKTHQMWAYGVADAGVNFLFEWGGYGSDKNLRVFDLSSADRKREQALPVISQQYWQNWIFDEENPISLINLINRKVADWFSKRVAKEFTQAKLDEYWMSNATWPIFGQGDDSDRTKHGSRKSGAKESGPEIRKSPLAKKIKDKDPVNKETILAFLYELRKSQSDEEGNLRQPETNLRENGLKVREVEVKVYVTAKAAYDAEGNVILERAPEQTGVPVVLPAVFEKTGTKLEAEALEARLGIIPVLNENKEHLTVLAKNTEGNMRRFYFERNITVVASGKTGELKGAYFGRLTKDKLNGLSEEDIVLNDGVALEIKGAGTMQAKHAWLTIGGTQDRDEARATLANLGWDISSDGDLTKDADSLLSKEHHVFSVEGIEYAIYKVGDRYQIERKFEPDTEVWRKMRNEEGRGSLNREEARDKLEGLGWSINEDGDLTEDADKLKSGEYIPFTIDTNGYRQQFAISRDGRKNYQIERKIKVAQHYAYYENSRGERLFTGKEAREKIAALGWDISADGDLTKDADKLQPQEFKPFTIGGEEYFICSENRKYYIGKVTEEEAWFYQSGPGLFLDLRFQPHEADCFGGLNIHDGRKTRKFQKIMLMNNGKLGEITIANELLLTPKTSLIWQVRFGKPVRLIMEEDEGRAAVIRHRKVLKEVLSRESKLKNIFRNIGLNTRAFLQTGLVFDQDGPNVLKDWELFSGLQNDLGEMRPVNPGREEEEIKDLLISIFTGLFTVNKLIDVRLRKGLMIIYLLALFGNNEAPVDSILEELRENGLINRNSIDSVNNRKNINLLATGWADVVYKHWLKAASSSGLTGPKAGKKVIRKKAIRKKAKKKASKNSDEDEDSSADKRFYRVDKAFLMKVKNIFMESKSVYAELTKLLDESDLQTLFPAMGEFKRNKDLTKVDTTVYEHIMLMINFLETIEKNQLNKFNDGIDRWSMTEELFTSYHRLFMEITNNSKDRQARALLYFIVLLHDIGMVVNKHEFGHEMAEPWLKEAGFSVKKIKQATRTILAHVDLGTLYERARTPGYLESGHSLNIKNLREKDKLEYLKRLAILTLLDVRSIRKGLYINESNVRFYLDVVRPRYIDALTEGFFEERVKAFCSTPELELISEDTSAPEYALARKKYGQANNLLKELKDLLGSKYEDFKEMIRSRIEALHYTNYFIWGFGSGESVVKMFAIMYVLTRGRAIPWVEFTASGDIRESVGCLVEEHILDNMSLEHIVKQDAKTLGAALSQRGMPVESFTREDGMQVLRFYNKTVYDTVGLEAALNKMLKKALPRKQAPPVRAERKGSTLNVSLSAKMPEALSSHPKTAVKILRQWIKANRLELTLITPQGRQLPILPKRVKEITFDSIHLTVDLT
ncbi:MAG: glycosyltransferase family 4 protein, partial [Deltaproteobacteria bacterium]|nr:glycosyltransferase family 4 protein [Deltaproteobacteria bacterium]